MGKTWRPHGDNMGTTGMLRPHVDDMETTRRPHGDNKITQNAITFE